MTSESGVTDNVHFALCCFSQSFHRAVLSLMQLIASDFLVFFRHSLEDELIVGPSTILSMGLTLGS